MGTPPVGAWAAFDGGLYLVFSNSWSHSKKFVRPFKSFSKAVRAFPMFTSPLGEEGGQSENLWGGNSCTTIGNYLGPGTLLGYEVNPKRDAKEGKESKRRQFAPKPPGSGTGESYVLQPLSNVRRSVGTDLLTRWGKILTEMVGALPHSNVRRACRRDYEPLGGLRAGQAETTEAVIHTRTKHKLPRTAPPTP